MGERVTDERLDELLALRPGLLLNRESVAELHALANECRAHRAAALSAEDVETLRRIRGYFDDVAIVSWNDKVFTTLDRLLSSASESGR